MLYAAKAKTQQFSGRRSNLIKKADQLARLCHADVALIIRRNGRYYTYRSTDHEQWPPIRSGIVSSIPMYRLQIDVAEGKIVSATDQPTL